MVKMPHSPPTSGVLSARPPTRRQSAHCVVNDLQIGDTTEKPVVMSLYNIGASAGNMIGPLLCNSNDTPYYKPDWRRPLVSRASSSVCRWRLFVLNKRQMHSASRTACRLSSATSAGSTATPATRMTGDSPRRNAFKVLTDSKNDEFVYAHRRAGQKFCESRRDI